jgi:hypothetical protein
MTCSVTHAMASTLIIAFLLVSVQLCRGTGYKVITILVAFPVQGNDRLWPIASFRVRKTIRSLSERSGHPIVGNASWPGRK